jgi:hypothetical protein
MPRLPLNGRNPVHRDPEGARQFVQADPNLVEFVPEQFARVDRRQFPPLCHVSSSLIMATESTGRPLVRLECEELFSILRPRSLWDVHHHDCELRKQL